MSIQDLQRLRRVERVALTVGIVGVVAAVVLGLLSPHNVLPAWRLAVFVALQPALGSLIFVLIHRLTGGDWANELSPFLLSGTRLLPWVWLLIVPLLWFPLAAQPRDAGKSPTEHAAPAPDRISQTTDAVGALEHVFAATPSRTMDHRLRMYFSHRLLVVRAILYGIALFLVSYAARRAFATSSRMRWIGPAGLIGLVFLLHLLVNDWVNLLDPGWYSTGFPLVWMTGQAIAGIALAVGAAMVFGADPTRRGTTGHVRGLDWANLILASMMLWSYVAFVQLLIIWSGNLPSEIAWYRHRALGGWRWAVVAIALLEFGAPFALLLSRKLKRRRGGLALIAALVLTGQIAYTAWIIVPAFPRALSEAPWLMAALPLAVLALWINRYLAGARTTLARITP